MINLKRTVVLNSLILMLTQLFAQGPNNSGTYYKNADGKKGSELKTALSEIIRNHKELSYDALWDCFRTTDVRDDGKSMGYVFKYHKLYFRLRPGWKL